MYTDLAVPGAGSGSDLLSIIGGAGVVVGEWCWVRGEEGGGGEGGEWRPGPQARGL